MGIKNIDLTEFPDFKDKDIEYLSDRSHKITFIFSYSVHEDKTIEMHKIAIMHPSKGQLAYYDCIELDNKDNGAEDFPKDFRFAKSLAEAKKNMAFFAKIWLKQLDIHNNGEIENLDITMSEKD
jgi:hypothetical protein